MKGNLSRLVPAVERELRDAANRTSQRNAERALQESELRYRLLWETSPDAVILMDPSGTIHFANPAVSTVFGYTAKKSSAKASPLFNRSNCAAISSARCSASSAVA